MVLSWKSHIGGAVEMAIETLEEDGRPLPEPEFETPYSGNLSLRLGSHLHRRVAERAEVEGTSINSLLRTAIAYYLGLRAGAEEAAHSAASVATRHRHSG